MATTRKLRSFWDIAFMASIAAGWLVVNALLVPNTGTSALGVLFVSLIPGYLAILGVFPRRRDLGAGLRLVLAIVASLGAVIAFLLVASWAGLPFDRPSIILAMALGTAALTAVATLRRFLLPLEEAYVPRFGLPSIPLPRTIPQRALALVTAALLVGSGVIVYTTAVRPPDHPFTQFYILGPNDTASDYPQNITTNQSGTLIVGIRSFENRTMQYSVLIYLTNETVGDATSVNSTEAWGPQPYSLRPGQGVLRRVSLAAGDTFEGAFSFSIPSPGLFRFWFLLYVDYPGPPYRQTFLWVTVKAA